MQVISELRTQSLLVFRPAALRLILSNNSWGGGVGMTQSPGVLTPGKVRLGIHCSCMCAINVLSLQWVCIK